MKKWEIHHTQSISDTQTILSLLLANRGQTTDADVERFIHVPDPQQLTPGDVDIDTEVLEKALARIRKAIAAKESIVVYADYDADGITAGTIMWETLYGLGARAMPYIPHRVEEGYGLSKKGIETVKELYNPTLIITVDHGITGREKVEYAKELGIEVIITDHHVKPDHLPDSTIVHTTKLCGAGVSWFVASQLLNASEIPVSSSELIALAAIGTIADMVPLVGANRSIAKYGLAAINATARVGLRALISEAGLTPGEIRTYNISHILAPRLNAMGRLVHAMDALRLLCTKQQDKAMALAQRLGETNKERQVLTTDMAMHAKELAKDSDKKLLFVADDNYNQGVIGLVAGKLVEEYYKPVIVLAKGELISKASARSISGFNIVEAIRSAGDILIDVGGHPMAAGFTVETKHVEELKKRLENLAAKQITDDMLVKTLKIDMEIPLKLVTQSLWTGIGDFEPFGLGNPEPVFATRNLQVVDVRAVGAGNKHLKLLLSDGLGTSIDGIAFNMGELYSRLMSDTVVDVAYAIDMNEWNGRRKLQLKVKDIAFPL